MGGGSVQLAGCADVVECCAELVAEALGEPTGLPEDKRAGLRIHLSHCASCSASIEAASRRAKPGRPAESEPATARSSRVSDPDSTGRLPTPETPAEDGQLERATSALASESVRAARIDREADALRARIGSTDADLATFFERMMSVMRREAHFAGVDMAHGDSTTEIVGKGVLKLMSRSALEWNDEAHFRRSFRTMLRNLIISEIRAGTAQKRGGGAHHTSIDGEDSRPLRGADGETRVLELLAIDEAVERLRSAEPEAHAVFVEHHVVGRSQAETAQELSLSRDQVKKLWSTAKWFIAEQLTEASIASMPATGPGAVGLAGTDLESQKRERHT